MQKVAVMQSAQLMQLQLQLLPRPIDVAPLTPLSLHVLNVLCDVCAWHVLHGCRTTHEEMSSALLALSRLVGLSSFSLEAAEVSRMHEEVRAGVGLKG